MTPTDTLDATGPELAVPFDTVCYLIARLHDLQGKSASTLSEGDTDDDPYLAVLEDRGNDPVEDEIRSVIDDLDEEAQVDLVALLWLGRDVGEWKELRELALQEHNDATAGYLIGTPLVADYLASGLEVLGFDCTEWLAKNV
jgi:hypothetical protein